jgi:hypothetical protein
MASGPAFASTQTLDDGTFVMANLASGEYELRAGDRVRRFRRGKDADPTRVVTVTVNAPDRAKARLTIEARTGVIEGRVIDAAGRPVTDAFLEYGPSEGGSGGPPRYAGSGRAPIVTDTDGRFSIDGLAEGAYALRAQRKGGGEANLDPVKSGARDVVLKMADGGSIAGTLTAKGAPVERFTLTVRNAQSGFHREELFFHAGGAFSVGDLPPGTYLVEAETPGGSTTADVTLAEGEQKSGIALSLTLRQTIEGRLVELESGAPIAGARFYVGGDSRSSIVNNDGHDDKSGPDGRFRIEGVLPGQWGLTVNTQDPSIASVSVPITVPEGASTTNLGVVRIPRLRVGPEDSRGLLGLYVSPSPGAPAAVGGAYGPAAEAGIQTGDVIVSIDGFDVQGANQYLIYPLIQVPAGRTVTFGLAGGRTVSVTARGT